MWGEGPAFVTGPGFISPLSGLVCDFISGNAKKNIYIKRNFSVDVAMGYGLDGRNTIPGVQINSEAPSLLSSESVLSPGIKLQGHVVSRSRW